MKRILLAISTIVLCANSVNISAAARIMRMLALQKNKLAFSMGTVVAAQNEKTETESDAQNSDVAIATPAESQVVAKRTITWKDAVGEDNEWRPHVNSQEYTAQYGEYPLPAKITLKTRNGAPLRITDGTGYEYWKATIGKKLWAMDKKNAEASREFTGSGSVRIYCHWCISEETNVTASGEIIEERKDFPINTRITVCERTSEGKSKAKCVDVQAKGDLIDIQIENLSPNEANSSKIYLRSGCRIHFEEKFTLKDYEEDRDAAEVALRRGSAITPEETQVEKARE